MIIKQTSTKGFDPIGIYGIYDKMSGKIIGIHTFANDLTAKTNVMKNMEKDLADIRLVKIAETDLYDPENTVATYADIPLF